MGVARVPGDSARAGPAEAARAEFTQVARNVRKASAVPEARSAKGAPAVAPGAEDISVSERPVGRRRPGKVSSIGKHVVGVVDLPVDASPARKTSEAENLERKLQSAVINVFECTLAESPPFCRDEVLAKGASNSR